MAIFILMAMVVPALAEEPYESLPANTAVFLGNHTCEKPASTGTQRSCSTIFDYSGLAFDPVTRRPLVFGGGHSSLFTDTVQYFEPATATWGQYYTPTPCASMDVVGGNFDSSRQAWLSGPSGPYPRPVSRHSYDMNVVVGREFLVIAQSVGMSACPGSNYGSGDPFFGGGRIAHYNLDTSEWTFSPTAPGDGHPEDGGNITYPGADWDPVLQRVVLVGRYGLWTYDPVSRVKVRHLGTWRDADTNATISGATIGYDNALVYAEVTDRHYYIARQAQLVYEVVLNRADLGQSRLRPIITGVPSDRARGATYDSVAQKILWGPSNGQIRVIDPVAKTFTQTSMLVQGTGTPGTGREHALVYDPTRNVTYFVNEQAQTWAYRYATAGTPPPVEPPDAPGVPPPPPGPPPAAGDGDGATDIAVYRHATGEWFVLRSSDGRVVRVPWGAPALGDVPVAADYDGDGVPDVAVYRRSTGEWFILRSSDQQPGAMAWGSPGHGDVPVPGDYDGDRRADVAVYRSTTGQWFIAASASGLRVERWGLPEFGDLPVPHDYDGDGRTDLTVYSGSSGEWFLKRSTDGEPVTVAWGAPALGDVPVPDDYDGDGRADIGVFRTATGEWFVRRSTDGGLTTVAWGAPALGDAPVPGDYDGDTKADIAVYRRSTGEWFVRRSSDGTLGTHLRWGGPDFGDAPMRPVTRLRGQPPPPPPPAPPAPPPPDDPGDGDDDEDDDDEDDD